MNTHRLTFEGTIEDIELFFECFCNERKTFMMKKMELLTLPNTEEHIKWVDNYIKYVDSVSSRIVIEEI